MFIVITFFYTISGTFIDSDEEGNYKIYDKHCSKRHLDFLVFNSNTVYHKKLKFNLQSILILFIQEPS